MSGFQHTVTDSAFANTGWKTYQFYFFIEILQTTIKQTAREHKIITHHCKSLKSFWKGEYDRSLISFPNILETSHFLVKEVQYLVFMSFCFCPSFHVFATSAGMVFTDRLETEIRSVSKFQFVFVRPILLSLL